jgi:hypothetical protein
LHPICIRYQCPRPDRRSKSAKPRPQPRGSAASRSGQIGDLGRLEVACHLEEVRQQRVGPTVPCDTWSVAQAAAGSCSAAGRPSTMARATIRFRGSSGPGSGRPTDRRAWVNTGTASGGESAPTSNILLPIRAAPAIVKSSLPYRGRTPCVGTLGMCAFLGTWPPPESRIGELSGPKH